MDATMDNCPPEIAAQQQILALQEALGQVKARNEDLQRIVTQARALNISLWEADRKKDEFIATLAHELRNPLASIRSSVEYLQVREAAAAAAADNADSGRAGAHGRIARQATHLTRLVDDMLDVARITRGKVELVSGRIDLLGTVAAAIDTMRPLFTARGQQLLVSTPAQPVYVHGDAVRLAQAVGNLLHNATKYSAPGTETRLVVTRMEGEVTVAVIDQGIGLDARALPMVFDLFVQGRHSTDLPQTGLGIGLALVKGLVEMHGGRVAAESAGADQGACFTLRLPTLADVPSEADALPVAALGVPFPKRVLVVDDNEDAAESMAALLRISGHDTRVAHAPDAALAQALSFGPEVVLLDIGLPGRDGYAVVREMRQMCPAGRTSPIYIALTGYGQEEDRRKAKEAGFDHHLTKPIDTLSLEKLMGR